MTRPSAQSIAVGVAAVAVILSANLVGEQLNSLFLQYPGIDKALHVVEYAVVFLIGRRIVGSAGLHGGRQAVAAAAATAALALVDEGVQSIAPGRTVDVFDLTANAAGIGLGFAATLDGPRRLAMASLAVAAGVALIYHSHMQLRDFSRGQMHERAHRFALARLHYKRALEAGVRTATLYNSLGWVEVESGEGDPARAVDYASAALAMRPKDPDILDTYGWALHYAGRSSEALEPLQRAFAGKPHMYCINYHLGAVYQALGRLDLAERHFKLQLRMTKSREARLAARALEGLQALRSNAAADSAVQR